jgi:hypothetical protein
MPLSLQEEIVETKRRLDELRRQRKAQVLAESKTRRKDLPKSPPKAPPSAIETESDFLHGAIAISQFLGMSVNAVYYRHARGGFQTPDGPGVWSVGPKALMASKTRLRGLGK